MPFSTIATDGPPSSAEIEVCIFGPSYGECIVVHLGGDNWIVVDSCLYGDTRESIALPYLRALGLDPSKVIKAIIVTHGHDDHCKGVNQLLRAATDAHVCISSALTNKEFLQFCTRMRKNKTTVAGTKLSEFSELIGEIADRNRRGLVTFSLASARTSIFGVDSSISGHGEACEVIAMSPSHGDVLNFLGRVSEMMPEANTTKRSISSATPNDASVATIIKIGTGVSILLGADLENSNKPTSGWQAVLNVNRARAFGIASSLYKIAHHGSETAYNPDVWAELMQPNAYSVLTPWKKGGGNLPTQSGVRKILIHTSNAYSTAYKIPLRVKERSPSVAFQLRENKVKPQLLFGQLGAVRFRMTHPSSRDWSVLLSETASPLSAFLRRPGRKKQTGSVRKK